MPGPVYDKTIYELLEDGVKYRLQQLVDEGVEICELPESEIEFNKAFLKPRVYINCDEMDSEEQLDTNKSVSMETVMICLIYNVRVKSGPNGGYDLKRRCEALLQGYVIPGAERLKSGKCKLVGRGSGVFIYHHLFKTRVVNQQIFEDNIPDMEIPGLSDAYVALNIGP